MIQKNRSVVFSLFEFLYASLQKAKALLQYFCKSTSLLVRIFTVFRISRQRARATERTNAIASLESFNMSYARQSFACMYFSPSSYAL